MPLNPSSEYMAFNVLRPDQIEAQQQELQRGRNDLAMQPLRVQQAQQQIQQGAGALDSQKLKMASDKLDYSLQSLSRVQDQSSYDAWRQDMHSKGIDTAGDPDVFDPNWKQKSLMDAVPMKEKLSQALQQAHLDETIRHNKTEEYNQSGGWGNAPDPNAAPASMPNNNPGNMRPVGATNGFQSFTTPEAGMAAMKNDLLLKVSGRSPAMGGKPPTLRNIISIWAPAGDNNNPDAYTSFVAKESGINPDMPLKPEDVDKIMPPMVKFEGGQGTGSNFKQKKDLSGLSGDEYLTELKNQNPGAPIAQIKAMASGDQKFPSAYALAKNPGLAKTLNAVYQYEPGASEQTFDAVRKFNTAKQGDTTRFLNNSIAHLDLLSQLSDALGNGDTRALNSIKNSFKTQFGSEAPTDFNAAKQLVAGEIVKAITGAGGGVEDRLTAQKALDSASSPQQLAGVIKNIQKLLGGQLGGLRQQYHAATGLSNFDTKYLTPETRKALSGMDTSQGQPAGNTAQSLKTPSGITYRVIQ